MLSRNWDLNLNAAPQSPRCLPNRICEGKEEERSNKPFSGCEGPADLGGEYSRSRSEADGLFGLFGLVLQSRMAEHLASHSSSYWKSHWPLCGRCRKPVW